MIVPVSGLSNEILYILVAEETVKLTNVKVRGLKKILVKVTPFQYSYLVRVSKILIQI